MDNNFRLPNNLQINPDILKNIKLRDITIPQTEIKTPNFQTDEDCIYYNFCNNLQITENKICRSGANINQRCSFGESRSIMLLSRLLTNEDIDKQE